MSTLSRKPLLTRRWVHVSASALLLAVSCLSFACYRPLTVLTWYGQYRLWQSGVTSHTIQAGKNRVHYLEAGSGPPVVLVHGLGGSAPQDWGGVITPLAATFHVYAIDLPGFGESEKPADGDFSMRGQSATVVAFCDALGIKKARLVGISMGGWVALYTAATQPDRVERLGLVASAGFRYDNPPSIDLFLPKTEKDLQGLLAVLFYQPPDFPWLLARDAVSRLDAQEDSIRRSAEAMLTGRDFLDGKLQKVTMPTLLLWGKQDRLVPLWYGEKIKAELPQAGLRVFDRCGHLPPRERRTEFLRELSEFLSAEPPVGNETREIR